MRVFVTGARGFVGPRLLRRLAERGATPVGVADPPDVTQAAQLEAALAEARPDALVHLAARSSVARSARELTATYCVNFGGTPNLLRAVARRAPRARVLLVSSGQLYGSGARGSPPFHEGSPLRPASPYARSKAAADLLGARHAARGLDVVRARPFNHTGAGQSDTFVASSFARQIAETEAGLAPARIRVGNLDAVRDFLDVEDVVEAYLRLLDPALAPGAYNVARGVGVSARELLSGLLDCARLRPEIEQDPARWRPTDVSVGDAARLRACGWAPRIPLRETLAGLLEDWRRRVSAP